MALSFSSRIDVNGSNSGTGGNITLSADGLLRLEGALSARGGESGGNGGVISLNAGASLIDSPQLIDLGAPAGQPGTLEQNAPSTAEVREGASGVGIFTRTFASNYSAVVYTDGSLTLPTETGTPNVSTGGVLVANSNPGIVFADLTHLGGNLLVSPTGQLPSGGYTSSITLTGGNLTPPAGVGSLNEDTAPKAPPSGVLVIGGNSPNNSPFLTTGEGNLVIFPTGQLISGTAPQPPTTSLTGTNQTHLLTITGSVPNLTTASGNYTGHGTVKLSGGVDFPSGTGTVNRGTINLRGLAMSQSDQSAMANAMQVTSPSGNAGLRLGAPQSLAEFSTHYPVPTRLALITGPQLPQGSSNVALPPPQAGMPLSYPFATDAFSAVFFSDPFQTAPDQRSQEKHPRD